MTTIHDHDHDHNEHGNLSAMACSMPVMQERVLPEEIEGTHRARLIRMSDKKWANGTEITYYYFREGEFSDKRNNIPLVEKGFKGWTDIGIGLKFKRVMDIDDSMVRIGFKQGDGAWSYVGRDCLQQGMSDRTMNFGWDLRGDRRGGGVDTPLHEIGHMLGFPHEHQNPNAGIVWDEEAVIKTFSAAPNNWDRGKITHNILRKISKDRVEGSNWDPDSIMSYSFGQGLIKSPEAFKSGLFPKDGLSQTDVKTMKQLYPPSSAENELIPLLPYKSHNISNLQEGSEVNFIIEPKASGKYMLHTSGAIDTLMVLSKLRQNGSRKNLKGDDDSGTNKNASITAYLKEGLKFVLTVRLIAKSNAKADGIVFLFPTMDGGNLGKDTVNKNGTPSNDNDLTPLMPYKSHNISNLPEGSEIIFIIEPTTSGNYRMNTSGAIDSSIVFSKLRPNGSKKKLKESKDTGTDQNASITAFLKEGLQFALTVRLIAKANAEADAAVFLVPDNSQ